MERRVPEFKRLAQLQLLLFFGVRMGVCERLGSLLVYTQYYSKPFSFVFACHVCMYGHTYSKSKDQPGMVVNPARGQLNREK